MSQTSNTVLNQMVQTVLAKRVVAGKGINSVQRAVMVRLENAVAIERSIAALNAAEKR